MRLARSAILAPVPGRDEVLLVQPLSGQAALLTPANADALRGLEGGGTLPAALPEATLREAGFVVDDAEDEQVLLRSALLAFQEELDKTPVQLLVVPTLSCNLRCTYCYQELFEPGAKGLVPPEAVDAFFAWVDRHHAADPVRPYVTLFGGEPLVDTPAHRDRVSRYLEGARARGLQVAVVTNGYDLEGFAPLLAAGPVKEVQVTIDGPAAVHDARRPHASGAGSFDRAVRGVDALVAAGVPANLRMVADRANLSSLPALSRLAASRGWLDLPASRFKTQIGRNYELFGCASRQDAGHLFDRVELWAEFVRLADLHPEVARFHRPRFHGMRHLAETGELPVANFDACPATKKEWAFAPDGGVYGCTATVGNPAWRLGSYWPEPRLDEAAVARWRGRSTRTIPACRSCELAPVCGGGCGALAAREGGDPMAADCRPVRELLGLGAAFYRLGERSGA
jgi:uncharacterized protein